MKLEGVHRKGGGVPRERKKIKKRLNFGRARAEQVTTPFKPRRIKRVVFKQRDRQEGHVYHADLTLGPIEDSHESNLGQKGHWGGSTSNSTGETRKDQKKKYADQKKNLGAGGKSRPTIQGAFGPRTSKGEVKEGWVVKVKRGGKR